MVTTRNKIWVALGGETNWGGGQGGAEKAKTAWSNANPPTAINNPRDIVFGVPEYKYESFFDWGGGAANGAMVPDTVVVTDVVYKNPKLTGMIARVSTLLVAISTAANLVLGSTPASYTMVGANGLLDYQAFGCVPKIYTLTIERGKPILEDVEFLHYDTVSAAIGTVTKVPFSTAAVKVHKDATIQVDSSARQIQSIKVTVTFRYGAEDDGDSDLNGAFLREPPVLTGVDFQVEITGRDATLAASLDGDLKAANTAGATAHTITIAIAYAGGTKTWTLTNLVMQLPENDTEHLHGEKVKPYTWVLVPGSTFSQSVA